MSWLAQLKNISI